MKPLCIFETPKAKSSSDVLVDRIDDILIPKLTAFNFRSSIVYLKEFGITPMLSVQKKSKRGNPVFVLPWIRPFSTNKNAARVLNDYPRLNVVKRLKNASDKEKIEGMFALVQKFHLYFLVLMQKTDDLYWIDKYENIPLEFWKTTYRQKDLPKDRIHFPDYKEFNFGKEKEFRKLLNEFTL